MDTDISKLTEGLFGSNAFFTSSIVIMMFGSIVAVLATLYHYVYDYVYKMLVVSVTVHSTEQCYDWLENWIEKQTFCKDTRSLNALTNWEDDEIVSKLKLVPDSGDHYFLFEGKYVWMNKHTEKQQPLNGSEPLSTIHLRCFSR